MKRKLAFGAALVAVLAAGAGTYAWAATGAAATQTINACLAGDGQLRLTALAGDCKKNETPLSWNTVGPVGPVGATGPTGATGRDGRDGASSGTPANPNAVTGTMTVTKQGASSPWDAIGLLATTHEIVSPRDATTGAASGKRMHKPYTITKEIDKSTPLLLGALVNNQHFTSVLIALSQGGQQVATVKLVNAVISDYVANGMTETWSFTYQSIEWTWLDGGIVASDSWEAAS
jgi:type VI secretion system secreted protein Hcp